MCRLGEPGQQPEAGVPGSAAYPAPPGASAPASATTNTEASSPGRGDSAAVKESLAGPSSPAPPRSSLTGEGSGGYTASPKSWYILFCIHFILTAGALLDYPRTQRNSHPGTPVMHKCASSISCTWTNCAGSDLPWVPR